MSNEEIEILGADYHRNGVGGAGFYVGLIQEGDSRKLVVAFDDQSECVAVLDIDLAAAGNIYMHPVAEVPGSGGNAWRGADHYGHLYAEMEKIVDKRRAAFLASLGL